MASAQEASTSVTWRIAVMFIAISVQHTRTFLHRTSSEMLRTKRLFITLALLKIADLVWLRTACTFVQRFRLASLTNRLGVLNFNTPFTATPIATRA